MLQFNNDMKEGSFDDRIKYRADAHEARVPADAWANIEQQKKKKRYGFFWWSIGTLLLAGLLFYGIYQRNSSPKIGQQKMATAQRVNTNPDEVSAYRNTNKKNLNNPTEENSIVAKEKDGEKITQANSDNLASSIPTSIAADRSRYSTDPINIKKDGIQAGSQFKTNRAFKKSKMDIANIQDRIPGEDKYDETTIASTTGKKAAKKVDNQNEGHDCARHHYR